MSQQIPASTPSASSIAAPTERLKNGRGILSYAQGNVNDFHRLEDVTVNSEWNVFEFLFDYRLKFCQKHLGNKFVVRYLPGQYDRPSINNKPNNMIELAFNVTGVPEVQIAGAEDKAKDLPLAKFYESFTHVKIEFSIPDFRPKMSRNECR